MTEYGAVFKEIRYEVFKVSFLNAFLNAALAFFISNVFATFLRFSVYYSLLPAVIVFLWSFIAGIRRYTLRRIEEANPEVSEILRTAHDNTGKDTLLVHALFLELMQKLETVTAGVFIDGRQTVTTLGVIALLSFAPLVIASKCPSCMLDNPLSNLPLPRVLGQETPLAPITAIDDAAGRDISGDKDIQKLGSEQLNIAASANDGGADFSKSQDLDNNKFKENAYPIDATAEQAQAGTGGKASEGELINDYSCKTKKTC